MPSKGSTQAASATTSDEQRLVAFSEWKRARKLPWDHHVTFFHFDEDANESNFSLQLKALHSVLYSLWNSIFAPTKTQISFKVYKGIALGFHFLIIKNERKSNFINRMLNEVVVCINSKCISSNKSLEELQAAFLILTELPKSTATKTLSNESPLWEWDPRDRPEVQVVPRHPFSSIYVYGSAICFTSHCLYWTKAPVFWRMTLSLTPYLLPGNFYGNFRKLHFCTPFSFTSLLLPLFYGNASILTATWSEFEPTLGNRIVMWLRPRPPFSSCPRSRCLLRPSNWLRARCITNCQTSESMHCFAFRFMTSPPSSYHLLLSNQISCISGTLEESLSSLATLRRKWTNCHEGSALTNWVHSSQSQIGHWVFAYYRSSVDSQDAHQNKHHSRERSSKLLFKVSIGNWIFLHWRGTAFFRCSCQLPKVARSSRQKLSKVSSMQRPKRGGKSEKTFTSPPCLSLSGLRTSLAFTTDLLKTTKKVGKRLLQQLSFCLFLAESMIDLYFHFIADEESTDQEKPTFSKSTLHMAQALFPSMLCTSFVEVIRLLDDHAVSLDGTAVYEVAYQVRKELLSLTSSSTV